MKELKYSGITKEELEAIKEACEQINRLEPHETRKVSGTDPISGEPWSHTANLPRAVRIQTTSIESNAEGDVKITLTGDAEAEELAALEERLSALEAKKV